MLPSISAQESKIKRAKRACNLCRMKKQKCELQREIGEACQKCREENLTCEFSSAPAPTLDAQIRQLQGKTTALEATILELAKIIYYLACNEEPVLEHSKNGLLVKKVTSVIRKHLVVSAQSKAAMKRSNLRRESTLQDTNSSEAKIATKNAQNQTQIQSIYTENGPLIKALLLVSQTLHYLTTKDLDSVDPEHRELVKAIIAIINEWGSPLDLIASERATALPSSNNHSSISQQIGENMYVGDIDSDTEMVRSENDGEISSESIMCDDSPMLRSTYDGMHITGIEYIPYSSSFGSRQMAFNPA